MNSKVYIKSYKNGLTVYLDASCEFSDILDETISKFRESRDFFKGGKIAVSYEGRILSASEEKALTAAIEEAADLTVLYIIGKDEETDSSYKKAVDRPIPERRDDALYARFYYGNIRKDDKIESDCSVVIVGDIEPGAKVSAKGNIIVMGGLYGTAVCEAESDSYKYFVAALHLSAEKVMISGLRYHSKEKARWVVRPKMSPKLLYVSDNAIVAENITLEAFQNLNR
ncbi:MAG: septum formation inhibitor [Lachnospiraceae bacterium]|nr:septum formation inhibitor [Lachnospiraceae bacterium]